MSTLIGNDTFQQICTIEVPDRTDETDKLDENLCDKAFSVITMQIVKVFVCA